MSKEFRTSNELASILAEAFRWTQKHSLKEIPLEYITWNIINKYVGKEDYVGTDKNMIKFFEVSDMQPGGEEAEGLGDRLTELLDDIIFSEGVKSEEANLDPWKGDVFGKEFKASSILLEDSLNRAKKTANTIFYKPEEYELQTSDLFLAITYDSKEECLGDILEEFALYRETLMDIMGSSESDTKIRTKVISGGEIFERMKDHERKQAEMSAKEDDEEFEMAGKSEGVSGKKAKADSKTPYLDQYSYDMSDAARSGKYDPVVGRDVEIDQIIEILCCRKKNNVVLLGDPGCGKTAIIELLAQRIIKDEVPGPLKGKRICSLDLNALVSGTKYRGEYEQRLQGIIKEVCSNPDIIVYIDEFHNLVGNGGASGSGDGANILKPYLARGEFQCIGSTTVDEYRKIVEKDGALKRRFQNIIITEPTEDQVVKILSGLSIKYGDYHNVRYTPEVLKACAEWSGRYIHDRYFPDKAIDCMDMAGSLRKLESGGASTVLDTKLNQLEEIKQKRVQAVLADDFDEGIRLKKIEEDLEKEISSIKTKGTSEKERKSWPEVTIEDVAKVVSKISKVPIDKISSADMEKLKEMKVALEKKVIGQPEAIDRVTISLQRNFLGLRDPKKPIASMLMVGPTGTGKTLICKEMAKEFFGSEKALIKFDMGEFSERHEVTKLTGSTASYVGYDDSPLLEQVRRQPYSVVLFDEIEKAAPEIFSIFLSILDESTVTLGNGQRVDFSNCIVVFTGNIGTKELALSGKGLGFGSKTSEEKKTDRERIVMKAVEKQFRPEFINRLSSIVVFNELEKPELLKIFDLEIAKLKERIKKAGYTLVVKSETKDLCVSQCDHKYGARDLQRAITKNIEDKVCQEMLSADMTGVKKIAVSGTTTDDIKVEFIVPTPKKKKVEVIPDTPSTPES